MAVRVEKKVLPLQNAGIEDFKQRYPSVRSVLGAESSFSGDVRQILHQHICQPVRLKILEIQFF